MQTELHRHLDVSLRPKTLYELGVLKGLIASSTSFADFHNELVLKSPMTDLASVLDKFLICQNVLDQEKALERIAKEVVEDCWSEGTRKVELRYSPHFVSQKSQLSWKESLLAFHRGVQEALKAHPEMQVGLLCITSRDAGPEVVEQGVDFFLDNTQYFVGIDLAGKEVNNPCRLFESSFKKVRDKNLKITIHAGEACGPDSIWEAIELLGAHRIGHGITSIQDPQLVRYLVEKQICLEMCPTSNWLTRAVPSFEEHPLPKLLRQGVPISINTDDPTIFGVDLPHEIQICREKMGLSVNEVHSCFQHASRASFL